MPDPLCDALLRGFEDLLNEFSEMQRVFGSTARCVAAAEPGVASLDLLPDERAVRHGDEGPITRSQGPLHSD